MKKIVFFNPKETNDQKEEPIVKHADIKHILSHPKPGSLVILDIDDTIGRVPQIIGLDAWFRFRIAQYIQEGHAQSEALSNAIVLYNLAQLASEKMIPLEKNLDIGGLIDALKNKGVNVIALTARNYELTEQTLKLLATLRVGLSQNVLKNTQFILDNKQVEIKNGIIFANGNHKGLCIEKAIAENHFKIQFHLFNEVHFVDDSEKNCDAVYQSLSKLNISKYQIWHYNYAEINLPLSPLDKKRAAIQEKHLVNQNKLLSDDEADRLLMM